MKNNLVKALAVWFAFLLATLLLSALTSCSPKKPLADAKTEITRWENRTTNTETNRPINDSLAYWIGQIKTARPECDSITRAEIDRVLMQLSRYVKSGDNSYRMSYDMQKKILSLVTRIGETNNSETIVEKGENKYFLVNRYTNTLTREQKFHVWLGRLIWIILAVFITWKIARR